MKKLFHYLLIFLSTFLYSLSSYGKELFPLEHYNQNIDHWLQPETQYYQQALINPTRQQKFFNNFKYHFFSPWNRQYINKILSKITQLKILESELITHFSNHNKKPDEIGYSENFRPHTAAWTNAIAENMNLKQFNQATYYALKRGITIANLNARMLPTEDVHFYDYHLAGQGYPFDNLQMSAIWVGTPVYILGETLDHAWVFILTPDHYIAWVKSNGIATVTDNFIQQWQQKQSLIAITQTATSIVDNNKHFLFSAYVGTVLPGREQDKNFQLMIPIQINGNAAITYTTLDKSHAVTMPLLSSPKHFAMLMKTLINRPYGWGNLYFYNDCSAELKNLFTPFGMWLPRQSQDQIKFSNMINLSNQSLTERLTYLIKHGHPLMTIVYIGGHIFLYVGNSNHDTVAITYQNIWGLSPKPPIRRAIIGQAVLLPLLKQYPEDLTLSSLAEKKYFKIVNLDEAADYDNNIDLKSMVNA